MDKSSQELEHEKVEKLQSEILSRIRNMIANEDATTILENRVNEMREFAQSQQPIIDSNKSQMTAQLKDAYGNQLTSTGTDDKVLSFTKYILSNDTLNWTLWLTMYNDSWVFRRAIDKPATDEIRCGITINNNMDERQKTDILDWYNSYAEELIEILQWGALFGGSVGVCLFDTFKDDKDYEKSIAQNIQKVRQAKCMRIYVVDRWYGIAPSTNNVKSMKSLDFGKPTYYDITMADGTRRRIHHDYILRYEHRKAPKLIKNGMLQGWGYAEGSHIIQELIRDDQLKSAVISLVNKSLIEVIKMSGMRGLFMGTDSANAEQLNKRLEMVNWARNFNSLTFLDKDDDYEMKDFGGVGGLADLLEQNMWLVASALEMEGVLFGELKGGLATDSASLENYSNTINNRCKSLVTPVIKKFLWIYYLMKDIKVYPKFEFNALARKQEDKDKMDAMKNYADILSQLLQDGVITTKKYAECIQAYTSKGIVAITFSDEEIEELKDNFDEEMEGIGMEEENGENAGEQDREGQQQQAIQK